MQISAITCLVEFSVSHYCRVYEFPVSHDNCRVYVAKDLHESLLQGM